MNFNIRSNSNPLIVAAVVVTFGLAACGKSVPPGQVSDSAAADAPKESATLGKAISDTAITASVKGRLGSDARVSDSDISVETNNGIVTLSGTAKGSDAKNAAEELARATPDVKGIDNRIAAPTALDSIAKNAEGVASDAGEAISDTVITTKLKAALIADETTKGTAINVTTQDGKVILSGEVASKRERENAIAIASGTGGVKKVDADALKVASR
ncbi:BON domain-containing protein [Nevskia sp.]|uniref:BON domain-containing protein n=1 Tax=Nevskia sp. TaxID=1929292 RepID=UPI0025FC8999|nr:BON domain-containing protein [Nevskia sp.]